MGGEKKPLGMRELGCADGCGRQMGGEKKPLGMSELACADGCGRRGCKGVAGNGWGEEAAGDERAWLRRRTLGMSELGCADGCGRQMGGENKPLDMSELGAADGVGARRWLEMGGEKKPLGMSELGCADGCGRRGSKGVAGNSSGEEAAGDQRAWLRGRLRTAWVQGVGWKWVGRRSRWRCASLAARTAAVGVGAREWLEMGGEKIISRWQ